jgi:hypothetical protein
MLDPPTLVIVRVCDLPGRSELGLVVANPFGNLNTMSIDYTLPEEMRLTVMGDLLVMLDRHFVVVRSRCRWALWSRGRVDQIRNFLGNLFLVGKLSVGHVLDS